MNRQYSSYPFANWQALDLNLLRVLYAMLAEANTTRAGERIGLSQPAVSASLGRLRQTLGDPLFVREGNRLVPTRYAERLRGPLGEALGSIERALVGAGTFQPAQSTMTFRLLGDDYLADILLPGLAKVLAVEAPQMRVEVLPLGPEPIAGQLAKGSIDIAFDRSDRQMPDWVDSVLALHAQPVVIAARGNRALRAAGCKPGAPLPLELFCTLPQAGFSPGGDFVALEDAALAAMGLRRHIAMTLPSFLSIARLVAGSQLIGSVPAPLARGLAKTLAVELFNYPFPFAAVPLKLFWHVRHTHDAAHRWIREHTLRLIRPFDAVAHPVQLTTAKKASRRIGAPQSKGRHRAHRQSAAPISDPGA